jgi:hypothetical protein
MRLPLSVPMAPRLLIPLPTGAAAMNRFDDPEMRLPTHRRAAVRRSASRRGCRLGSPYERPRLRLVYSRRRAAPLPFGMHPALPSTLAFAALSVTALAFAAVVDVANAVAHTAATVGTQLRSVRG